MSLEIQIVKVISFFEITQAISFLKPEIWALVLLKLLHFDPLDKIVLLITISQCILGKTSAHNLIS